ncbi:AraC family transcriptional regulator [Gordonia sp. PP30]|uniref:AraC family transcriptional regulator n=1 Tax=Gordonia sp. PP30 TaxID=2935861 RepID=UPI0024B4DEE4|nr:AraC family transcriptional regulator [Gordonia sp. PP30]
MCGEFDTDSAAADGVLSVLPAVIHCEASAPGSAWLPLSIELLLVETRGLRPGRHVMASRILDLLFIHALRQWAATTDIAVPGWLTAAMDPNIGAALTAIHRDPSAPWSVDSLAQTALLSRSAFAESFTRLLGVAPAAYVAQCRLDRAAELLLDTHLSIAGIGRSVGYASESGFSRAFSRRFGRPPRTWRSESRSARRV